LNYGAAIHTAYRCNYPVLMTSGTGPRAYQGSMPGARDNAIQWVQEPRDQGEIVRQYTKADHRLEHQDNPGLMVSRLLQIPVSDNRSANSMNFPHTHPHYGTGPALKNADAVLVIESPVPWIPSEGPTPDAVVAWIEQDPVQSRYKTMEYQADLWLPVDTTLA